MSARRATKCETLAAGDEYAADVCVTVRTTSDKRTTLNSGQAVSDFMHKCVSIGGLGREKYWIIVCDTKLHPLALVELFAGGVASSVVDPKYLFRRALAVPGGAGVFCIHNHPSGDNFPSPEDRQLAQRISEIGRVLTLQVFDHLVLTADPGVWHSEVSGLSGRSRL